MPGEMLGDQLLELVSSAKERVVLVAPFIKVDALQRVLDTIPISARLGHVRQAGVISQVA
jgi:hypothetical protein